MVLEMTAGNGAGSRIVVSETLKLPARVWRAAFTGLLETPDFSHRLRELQIPTLIMWGDHDTYADRAAQDRLVELIPRARLVVYQGFGHALHWEDPKAFTNDVLTFLSHALMFQADVASPGSFMGIAATHPA